MIFDSDEEGKNDKENGRKVNLQRTESLPSPEKLRWFEKKKSVYCVG